jgi:hypothetical protein
MPVVMVAVATLLGAGDVARDPLADPLVGTIVDAGCPRPGGVTRCALGVWEPERDDGVCIGSEPVAVSLAGAGSSSSSASYL